MPRRLKQIPKFARESDERAFWESRDSSSYVDWTRAQIASFPHLRPSTRTISLRLPEDVLNAIRNHANKLDVPYQSLMKLWLAEKAAHPLPFVSAPVPKLRKTR
jgi:predicted DNA binding CopG/RHH family protein